MFVSERVKKRQRSTDVQSQQVYSFSTEVVHSNITGEYVAVVFLLSGGAPSPFSVLWIPTVEKEQSEQWKVLL